MRGLTAKMSLEYRPKWSECLRPADTHVKTGISSRAQATGMATLVCLGTARKSAPAPRRPEGIRAERDAVGHHLGKLQE